MKKKITAFLFAIILCLAAVVPVFAETSNGFASDHYCVVDCAGLLSDSDKERLENKIDEIRNRQKLDITVLTLDTLDDLTPQEYADEFYEEALLGYGENWDGVLFWSA